MQTTYTDSMREEYGADFDAYPCNHHGGRVSQFVVKCIDLRTGEITIDDLKQSLEQALRDCADFAKHNPGFSYAPIPASDDDAFLGFLEMIDD